MTPTSSVLKYFGAVKVFCSSNSGGGIAALLYNKNPEFFSACPEYCVLRADVFH